MTTPPSDGPEYTDPAAVPGTAPEDGQSGQPHAESHPAAPPADEVPFDPYRYGAPEHPVPPEYAPPGYVPPPTQLPPGPAGSPYSTDAPQYPYPYAPQAYPGQPGAQQPGYDQQPGYGQPGYGQQQYGQPYGPPPAWMTQYPQPNAGNGKAIAALVFGILSVVLFWASFLDAIPVLLAVILGVIAMNDAKRARSARGMAVTAVVLGIVGAIAATVFTVVIYTRVKPCFDDFNSGSAEFNSCIHQRL